MESKAANLQWSSSRNVRALPLETQDMCPNTWGFFENTCFKFFGKAQVFCRCCLQVPLGQVQHLFSLYE